MKKIIWTLWLIIYAKSGFSIDLAVKPEQITLNYQLQTITNSYNFDELKNSSLFELNQQEESSIRNGYYYFTDSDSLFAPYVSADINYAQITKIEECNDLQNIDICAVQYNNAGLSMLAQIGFNYKLNKNAFLNLEAKLPVNNSIFNTLNMEQVGTEYKPSNGKLDSSPWILGIGIGYDF